MSVIKIFPTQSKTKDTRTQTKDSLSIQESKSIMALTDRS